MALRALVNLGRGLLLVSLLFLYPVFFQNPFHQHLAILTCLYALLGIGWNVLGGFAGQVSFGHSVFFAAGAYSLVLAEAKFGLSPWVGLLIGIVVAAILSLIIGYPTLGLKGRYFTIATMVLGEIGSILVMNAPFLGGAAGMYVPVLPQGLANFQWHTVKWPYYYSILILDILAIVGVDFLRRSKYGYYLRALGTQQDAAEAVGIDTKKYKMVASCLSAVITAVGGAFYTNYVLFVDPESVLTSAKSVMFVVVTLVGGIGTLFGPVVGSLIIIPMSEMTRILFSGSGKAVDLIVYGAILMATTLFAPTGLLGVAAKLRAYGKSCRVPKEEAVS